ncbi:MAG: hypothetical protein DHS20C10_06390 [marine bacterium B5-7]|nr:MAG: hypothetical protein DHS20C10_06390 [marine bacterium B5-7]
MPFSATKILLYANLTELLKNPLNKIMYGPDSWLDTSMSGLTPLHLLLASDEGCAFVIKELETISDQQRLTTLQAAFFSRYIPVMTCGEGGVCPISRAPMRVDDMLMYCAANGAGAVHFGFIGERDTYNCAMQQSYSSQALSQCPETRMPIKWVIYFSMLPEVFQKWILKEEQDGRVRLTAINDVTLDGAKEHRESLEK